ncbi:MAG: clan AA aspartic protease [Akkermansiaceae bacterium]|nr:clan AA aspartic protease [Armatimonadota bacterium]
MMEGKVNDELEAAVELTVFGTGLRKRQVIALVDTGFNDFLVLPRDVVDYLPLPKTTGENFITLADGSEITDSYRLGEILWDGQKRKVLILALDGNPLLGMALMEGCDLNVSANAGGAVRLTKQEPEPQS